MKKWIVLLMALLTIGMIFLSCSDDSSSEPKLDSDTTIPTITIAFPSNLTEYNEGEPVTIRVVADDNESVELVEFYVDGYVVNTDNSDPYEYEWSTTGKVGNHTIMTKAIDSSGNIGE